MIVTATGQDRLRLVTQHDHAHLAGRILALWRADDLPEHPRRDDLLFAAREHDNGWREEDAAPRLDPATGRPHDFTTMPMGPRVEIWDRSTGRHQERRPYAALLVTHHALHLHQDRRDETDPAWQTLFALLDARAEELYEATAAPPEQVAAEYRFLHLVDLASLMLAAGWQGPIERMGHRLELAGEGLLTVDPFPLAGTTTFRLACRHVPGRPYGSAAELGEELLAARWESLPVRLAPGA